MEATKDPLQERQASTNLCDVSISLYYPSYNRINLKINLFLIKLGG